MGWYSRAAQHAPDHPPHHPPDHRTAASRQGVSVPGVVLLAVEEQVGVVGVEELASSRSLRSSLEVALEPGSRPLSAVEGLEIREPALSEVGRPEPGSTKGTPPAQVEEEEEEEGVRLHILHQDSVKKLISQSNSYNSRQLDYFDIQTFQYRTYILRKYYKNNFKYKNYYDCNSMVMIDCNSHINNYEIINVLKGIIHSRVCVCVCLSVCLSVRVCVRVCV